MACRSVYDDGSTHKGLNLITYLDDFSRRATGSVLFKEDASENAVTALHQAVSMFGVPATILSDNGSCFVGRGNRKKKTGTWTPTLFENELLNLKIGLINSRPYTRRPTENWRGFIEPLRRKYGAMTDWMIISNITTLTGCIFHWT